MPNDEQEQDRMDLVFAPTVLHTFRVPLIFTNKLSVTICQPIQPLLFLHPTKHDLVGYFC